MADELKKPDLEEIVNKDRNQIAGTPILRQEHLPEANSESKEGHGEEKKKETKSTIDSIFGESANFLKSTFYSSLGIAQPLIQGTLYPATMRDGFILAGATAAGDYTTARKKGEKYTAKDFAESSAVGTAITVPVYYAYEAMNKIPLDSLAGYAGRAAVFGGMVYPLYIGAYQTIDYIVKNKTFKGLGTYLKENYWPSLKWAWTRVFPFGLANVLFMPPVLQIPIGAVLSYIVALFAAPKKGEVSEERKKDKTPYLAVAGNLARKTVSSITDKISGVFEVAYKINEQLVVKYGSKITSRPEPAPAH